MAKRSAERSNNHGISSSSVYENKKLPLADDNLLLHKNKPTQKLRLIKSESSPSLFLSNGIEEKVSRDSKKPIKTFTESEKIRSTSSVRLSQFVIVDSVLKDTKIDSNLDASLPPSLHSIYQKFINNKTLIDHFQAKDEFYRGVGLLGIGIEERIYNTRKILEESLKRSFRLRSNPKPKRQFDGTLITRALKNSSKLTLPNDVKTEKVKYNVFTIGNDSLKKSSRRQAIRKSVKKSSSLKRPAANGDNDDDEDAATAGDNNNDTRSIALSRTKRQPKVPQLDFKYCYSEGFVSRPRKLADTRTKVEDQFMEIVDSDSSSSVVEVFPQPTQDKENSEVHMPSKEARKQWRPRDNSNRALNLLDKLRLGLQCTVIQTERDVIIENLTVDDLSTLRSRLQGLATFKNIEAEYDKNGQETARATIDRRVLNLPATETRQSVAARRSQTVPVAAPRAPDNGPGEDRTQPWVRPKVRAVKKVRKLYTQCASTPNILARAQTTPTRSDQPQTRPSDTPGPATAPVSFYPQITSVIMEPAHDQIVVKTEPLPPQLSPATTLDTVPAITAVASTTTAATAMSASQLLMLKKGGPPPTGNEVPVTATSAISIAGNEQMFANQILKPFKLLFVLSRHSGRPFLLPRPRGSR